MIQTEADAMREILDWSSDRPAWQRDALRRLVAQDESLADDDIEEIVAICKDPSLSHQALATTDITAQKTGAPTVALKNLHNVQNVNALAENQSLTFIFKGVTIIYGDNGAYWIRAAFIKVHAQILMIRASAVSLNLTMLKDS